VSVRTDIASRMAAALASLQEKWGGRRLPKAFYLSEADWTEFSAGEWPTVQTMWGNNPPKLRTDPAFNGVPVRASKSSGETASRLYDHSSYGHSLQSAEPASPRPASPLPAEQVFAALDALSRKRALTDRESRALEAAMKGQVILSSRDALRLRIGQ
jgi:hypothetical protein